MNILFVSPMPIVASRGGIQRVSDILAKEFIALGNQTYFLCRREEKLIKENMFSAPQFYIPIENISSSIDNYLSLLSRLHIDVVIFQWVDDLIYHWLKNTPNKIKVISTIHHQPFQGIGYERAIAKWSNPINFKMKCWKYLGIIFPFAHRYVNVKIERNGLERMLPYVDRICFLSERFIPRVRQYMPSIDVHKLCGINNPLPVVNREVFNIEEKENLILFVGRITNASKNVYQFINVWQNFSQLHSDWNAIVIGDGPDLCACRKYVKSKNIKRISFEGYCNNPSIYYRRAKAICITSYAEGFSMVLVESMQYGCIPFIYDTYEALHDIVIDNVTGYISCAFDTNDMVTKISAIAENHEKYRKIVPQIISSVEKFQASKIAKKWLALINNI